MNIGIDIDNTISTTRETIICYAEKFIRDKNLPKRFEPSFYTIEQSFDWDITTSQAFLNTYLPDIYRQVLPKPHAAEVIRELNQNHRIILITSRNQRDETVAAITLEWLKDHKIEYDKLVMNTTENMHHHSKLEDCVNNGVEIMIEDHHDLALELSSHFPVILFDYPYNNHLINDNIIRVRNWLEVKQTIAQMQSDL